jgi:hypothetical protein
MPDLGKKRADETTITLFDVPEPKPESHAVPEPTGPASPGPETVTATVLASLTYKANKKRAGRVSVSDAQVGALLTALAASPSRRLAPVAAASALEVSPVLLRGAIMQAQQLLNIDGAAVIRIDADGATVILDEAALQEQYGIRL